MTATTATAGLTAAGPTYYNNLGSSADAATTRSAAGDTAGMQDRFLKLLVAQMSNQDPMNPMDNAQMTTQIAQINTVTGIQQLNETMKGMAAQLSALQMMQAGSLVGRDVLAEGDRLAIDAKTHSAAGAFRLDGAASSVSIEVSTERGSVVDTVALGARGAGQHDFSLDASNWPANTALRFKVIASNGAQPVASTALMRATVSAVSSSSDGGLALSLLGGGTLPYGSVRSVL